MRKLLLPAFLGLTCMAVYADNNLVPYFMADFNIQENPTKATVGKDVVFVNTKYDEDLEMELTYDPVEFICDGKGVTPDDGYVLVPQYSYIKVDLSDLPGFVNPEDPDNPYVGTYTVVFDIKVPVVNTYHCLLQTNPYNTTDAKLCLNGKGIFGSGFLGGYSDDYIVPWAAEKDTWYRLAFTANRADGAYGLYADGVQIKSGISDWVKMIDGKYALEKEGVLFFADEDGEDAEIYCTKLMFFDRALTADEVKTLGDPGTYVSASVMGVSADDSVSLTVNNGTVNVKVNNDKPATVTVYNICGCTVAEATVNNEYTWNSADAVTGAYIVKVAAGDCVKTTKLIVK